jgi:hypothetical protein
MRVQFTLMAHSQMVFGLRKGVPPIGFRGLTWFAILAGSNTQHDRIARGGALRYLKILRILYSYSVKALLAKKSREGRLMLQSRYSSLYVPCKPAPLSLILRRNTWTPLCWRYTATSCVDCIAGLGERLSWKKLLGKNSEVQYVTNTRGPTSPE